jgi:large-conductance mechanosensitive channel
MRFDFKDLPNKMMPVVSCLKRYAVFISIIIVLFIAAFFVLRINQYSRMEPSDEAVEEKLQTVQRPKVDQAILDKIQQLQDQNVQVQTLFDQARNNPFNE